MTILFQPTKSNLFIAGTRRRVLPVWGRHVRLLEAAKPAESGLEECNAGVRLHAGSYIRLWRMVFGLNSPQNRT